MNARLASEVSYARTIWTSVQDSLASMALVSRAEAPTPAFVSLGGVVVTVTFQWMTVGAAHACIPARAST